MANLISKIKSSLSKWIKTQGIDKFSWPGVFVVFSVSEQGLMNVCSHIKNQPEHHKKRTFKEELVDFFKKYQVDYDEQYVWD